MLSDLPDSDTLRAMLDAAAKGPVSATVQGWTDGALALAEIAPALAEEVIRLRAESRWLTEYKDRLVTGSIKAGAARIEARSVAETASDRANREAERADLAEARTAIAREVAAKLAEKLEHEARPLMPDHACIQCRPEGEMVDPSFVCAYHTALAWRTCVD